MVWIHFDNEIPKFEGFCLEIIHKPGLIWYWNWTWYHFGIKSRFSINFSIEIKLKSILCLVSKFWYHALLLPIWCWNYVLGANFALFITPFLVSKSSLTSSFHQFVCQFATSILNLSSLSFVFHIFVHLHPSLMNFQHLHLPPITLGYLGCLDICLICVFYPLFAAFYTRFKH